MSESLKKKAVKGVAWTSLDHVVGLGFGFVIGVILARLLNPSDYGLLAMIGVFNSIASTFINSGFGSALVRKPDLIEDDNTTAFSFNIVVAIFMVGVIWMIAPWVAEFYDKPILSSLMRVESVLLIVSSFGLVQNTQLTRALNFKAKMILNVVPQVLSGVVAIVAAYRGFGVWSLVIQHYVGGVTGLVLIWIISPWRPRGKWNKSSFRYLWGYGSKLLASSLLNTLYGNIYPIVIGKFYSAADLGLYTRAKGYPNIPATGITGVMQQVTFPVLSKIQDDTVRLTSGYRRMLRLAVFLVFPIMIGMAALAYPLVVVIVTEKWAECAPYMQVICFASMWYPVHAINLSLLQVKGRSDLFLRLEVIKKMLGLIIVFCSVPFGIMGICVGAVCSSIICLFINTYYTGKLFHMGFVQQMMDMTPTLLNSLVMGAAIYFVTLPIGENVIKLAVGIPLGIALYLALAWIFKLPELQEAIDIIRRR